MTLENRKSEPGRMRGKQGTTLIEVLMSMIVLLVAVGGMLGSLSSFSVLGESSREKSLAFLAAQRMLEQMQLEDFDEVFVRFNGTNADDPAGVISPGPDFDVLGLKTQAGDPDGLTGRVVFPVDPNQPGLLDENRVAPDFGLPRDLNGDGDLTNGNRAGDYAVLPVRIVVEWSGANDNAIELQTVLRSNRW